MPTITVYKFQVYAIASDQMQSSRRLATREAIEKIARGEVLEDTALEIDVSEIGGEVPGMTRRDYQPSVLRAGSFQTRVQPPR